MRHGRYAMAPAGRRYDYRGVSSVSEMAGEIGRLTLPVAIPRDAPWTGLARAQIYIPDQFDAITS
ncbi:hypothetical protein MPLA_140030 [Mesorhizobium sp. ORS 3359]|nr:hypothetical protein MPLA_140030 [Mesorhizobium sp. ORS 3359]